MQDYWGVGKAEKPMLPMIAVPTTAGTGSECQSFALIADETTHQKMACGDPKAAPRAAILDPNQVDVAGAGCAGTRRDRRHDHRQRKAILGQRTHVAPPRLGMNDD